MDVGSCAGSTNLDWGLIVGSKVAVGVGKSVEVGVAVDVVVPVGSWVGSCIDWTTSSVWLCGTVAVAETTSVATLLLLTVPLPA